MIRKQLLQKYVTDYLEKNNNCFDLCEYNTEWIVAGDYSDAIFPSEEKLIEYACIELTEVFVKRGGFDYPEDFSLSASITRNTGNIVFPHALFMQYYSINKHNENILSKIFFDYLFLHSGTDIGIGTHPMIDLALLTSCYSYVNNDTSYCADTDLFLAKWPYYPPRWVIQRVHAYHQEDFTWCRDLPLESYHWYENQQWEYFMHFFNE